MVVGLSVLGVSVGVSVLLVVLSVASGVSVGAFQCGNVVVALFVEGGRVGKSDGAIIGT